MTVGTHIGRGTLLSKVVSPSQGRYPLERVDSQELGWGTPTQPIPGMGQELGWGTPTQPIPGMVSTHPRCGLVPAP